MHRCFVPLLGCQCLARPCLALRLGCQSVPRAPLRRYSLSPLLGRCCLAPSVGCQCLALSAPPWASLPLTHTGCNTNARVSGSGMHQNIPTFVRDHVGLSGSAALSCAPPPAASGTHSGCNRCGLHRGLAPAMGDQPPYHLIDRRLPAACSTNAYLGRCSGSTSKQTPRCSVAPPQSAHMCGRRDGRSGGSGAIDRAVHVNCRCRQVLMSDGGGCGSDSCERRFGEPAAAAGWCRCRGLGSDGCANLFGWPPSPSPSVCWRRRPAPMCVDVEPSENRAAHAPFVVTASPVAVRRPSPAPRILVRRMVTAVAVAEKHEGGGWHTVL